MALSFRVKLFLLCLLVILSLAAGILWFNSQTKDYKPGVNKEFDKAVNQAQIVYQDSKKLGVNFDSGPCLSNNLMPSWVLDLVHSPRVALDNLEENQCSAYLSGQANHLIELDLEGNLVRVK